MKYEKKVTYFMILIALVLSLVYISTGRYLSLNEDIRHVTGIILNKSDGNVEIKDENDNIYKFPEEDIKEDLGTEVKVDYKEDKNPSTSKPNTSTGSKPSTGTSTKPSESKPNTDAEKPNDNNTVIDYEVIKESDIPKGWLDGGLFKEHYVKAYIKLKSMSLDEKIGQTLLARYPGNNISSVLNQYHLGGFIFYEKDFKGKSRDSVLNMIRSAQSASQISLLTAIDEEGGKVSRLSSNSNLTSTPFKSPQDLYKEGSWTAIRDDVKNKSSILKGLGLNLNLAPVVDVSTNPDDYIYGRTIGLGTEDTSKYASTVIGASKGTGVSYTLKHFPGYGSNLDTHITGSVDKKSLDKIMSEDIPPFRAGIAAGAEAVLVSHNIVESIDSANESSISKKVHDLLRNDLGFKGVVITDDISMGAMSKVQNVASKAILAGNDILITTDYATSFNDIKAHVNSGAISEDTLNRIVFRILSWKYYKGLI